MNLEQQPKYAVPLDKAIAPYRSPFYQDAGERNLIRTLFLNQIKEEKYSQPSVKPYSALLNIAESGGLGGYTHPTKLITYILESPDFCDKFGALSENESGKRHILTVAAAKEMGRLYRLRSAATYEVFGARIDKEQEIQRYTEEIKMLSSFIDNLSLTESPGSPPEGNRLPWPDRGLPSAETNRH
ncbi:MAG: hypothetical protein HYW86_03320 [Candidatus Roizmanbacteria bacterium]|nr:MAG: hypothetical protein HYW86_03320 [Candidatus Roizmanbacteria bacterium]